jgi:hypothetical protein
LTNFDSCVGDDDELYCVVLFILHQMNMSGLLTSIAKQMLSVCLPRLLASDQPITARTLSRCLPSAHMPMVAGLLQGIVVHTV